MPFVAADPKRYMFAVVGSGHCVPFVREATGAPHTDAWRRGVKVRGGNVPAGTAIASFDRNGRYENDTTGRSHAAVLIAETADGLLVYDQWSGHPVQQRLIRFRDGAGQPVNDGDQYAVIEPAEPAVA